VITSWSWTFGDGTTSRQRYPVKTYLRAGTFTATLTVKGPGGARSISHGGLSVAVLPSFPDGGFEGQAAGVAPASPWSASGEAVLVRSSSTGADPGFPADGTRWCEIGAEGTSAAVPPSNPLGPGDPPEGTAEVQQTFVFQALAPELAFRAAFLLAEAGGAGGDFLSVDLTDGLTSWNVFLADGSADFPLTSTIHGLPMTEPRTVLVDLRTLFPAAVQGSPITLRASVGNVGGDVAPSRGYVDGFRFVPASAASFRNGTGRNAARYVSGPPVLGGSWTVQVDTTGHAGARYLQLVAMQRPASGTLRTAGEVLTAGRKLFAQTWAAVPGLNTRVIPLPLDLALVGQTLATQVTITGGQAELCNAYDVRIGF
jgi:PKD repeat protein